LFLLTGHIGWLKVKQIRNWATLTFQASALHVFFNHRALFGFQDEGLKFFYKSIFVSILTFGLNIKNVTNPTDNLFPLPIQPQKTPNTEYSTTNFNHLQVSNKHSDNNVYSNEFFV